MRALCRCFLWAGLSACAATSLAASASSVSASKPAEVRAGTVSVWVDLDLPALAEVPASERAALRPHILAQQAQVMLGLQALGAKELARVQHVHNAVAVRLDASQMAAARGLPGVRLVRIARDIERRPPVEKVRN
jgi:hypothetical protein